MQDLWGARGLASWVQGSASFSTPYEGFIYVMSFVLNDPDNIVDS